MRLVFALQALGDPAPLRQEVAALSKRALEDPDAGERARAVQGLGRFARDRSADV